MTAQSQHTDVVHSPHTGSTVGSTGAHYSAKQLAAEFNVASSTLRTRWYPWLEKVAPKDLLKTEAGYTELAHTLFSELAQVDATERPAWVADAKTRYADEWSNAGVIDAELMPEEVGGVLAMMNNQHNASELAIAQQTQSIESLIESLQQAENSFSEAELAAFRAAGVQRGLARFQVETQAELETLNHLRTKRMEG